MNTSKVGRFALVLWRLWTRTIMSKVGHSLGFFVGATLGSFIHFFQFGFQQGEAQSKAAVIRLDNIRKYEAMKRADDDE